MTNPAPLDKKLKRKICGGMYRWMKYSWDGSLTLVCEKTNKNVGYVSTVDTEHNFNYVKADSDEVSWSTNHLTLRQKIRLMETLASLGEIR